jgi:preprotein translocase subunit Sss1
MKRILFNNYPTMVTISGGKIYFEIPNTREFINELIEKLKNCFYTKKVSFSLETVKDNAKLVKVTIVLNEHKKPSKENFKEILDVFKK